MTGFAPERPVVDSARQSVVEEFEYQVDAEPARPAVVCDRRRVAFSELDSVANAIANRLLGERGSKPEPVPLLVRSPELMLAAMLGVMKAGKCYAAVNPLHPLPQVERLLDELDASILIYDYAARTAAQKISPARTLVSLCADEIEADGGGGERPGLRFDASRLAYVRYTSGSTGRPSGFAHSRGDMLHNLRRHRPLAVERGDCLTLISGDGFVSSVSNPFLALVSGAALAPYSFRESGVEDVMRWLKGVGATALYSFPSFLRQVAAASDGSAPLRALRLIYLGGESVLSSDLAASRRLFPAATIFVGLNSTETGLTCLNKVEVDEPLPDPVPVGRPVLDVEIEVNGEGSEPTAAGDPGELIIRSPYVRPYHWGLRGGLRGNATEESGAFRTGDCVHIAEDGAIFHLGRVDDMVKVRGYRVEPAEVERAIASVPGVMEVAVVKAVAPAREDSELCAYLVVDSPELDEFTIRSAVASTLPSAMIPAKLVLIESLPRLGNGKVDRRGLAAWSSSAADGVSVTGALATAPEVEAQIAAIWTSVLDIDDIGLEDDFFALGGTSISALSVVSRIRRDLDVRLPLAALFKTPTVSALAAIVSGQEVSVVRPKSDDITVRLAREGDFDAVARLVNRYIATTSYNFRTKPQTAAEWIEEWGVSREFYPWLVSTVDDSLLGVAYAGRWKAREAYDWCAEVTTYVAPEAIRRGIGRRLCQRLLEMLDAQGYTTQVAVIALPNDPSVGLHEAFGFDKAGILRGVGCKQGSWWDVGFWQRGPTESNPSGEPVRRVADIAG